MTTALSRPVRPVRRVVVSRSFGNLIVTMAREGLYLREKGRRTQYGPVDYGKVYQRAVAEYVAALKSAKQAERKARRLSRSSRSRQGD